MEPYIFQLSKNININKATEEEIRDIDDGELLDINFGEGDITNVITMTYYLRKRSTTEKRKRSECG